MGTQGLCGMTELRRGSQVGRQLCVRACGFCSGHAYCEAAPVATEDVRALLGPWRAAYRGAQ